MRDTAMAIITRVNAIFQQIIRLFWYFTIFVIAVHSVPTIGKNSGTFVLFIFVFVRSIS